MSEEKKPFTVKDRRHFAADGEPRDDAVAAGRGAPTSAEPAAADRPAPTPASAPAEPEPAAAAEERPTLVGFFAGLAAQAGMLLSGELSPGGEEPSGPDLPGVRHLISILEMLEEKTRGNRSPEEDRAIETLLYQLRMGYLEMTRSVS